MNVQSYGVVEIDRWIAWIAVLKLWYLILMRVFADITSTNLNIPHFEILGTPVIKLNVGDMISWNKLHHILTYHNKEREFISQSC